MADLRRDLAELRMRVEYPEPEHGGVHEMIDANLVDSVRDLQERADTLLLLRAFDVNPQELREADDQVRVAQASMKGSGSTSCSLCEAEPSVIERDIGDGEVMALGASCNGALDEADALGL